MLYTAISGIGSSYVVLSLRFDKRYISSTCVLIQAIRFDFVVMIVGLNLCMKLLRCIAWDCCRFQIE